MYCSLARPSDVGAEHQLGHCMAAHDAQACVLSSAQACRGCLARPQNRGMQCMRESARLWPVIPSGTARTVER